MKCPADGETLVMTERSGVEIDYCPNCRGVWLDHGELDKIIERGASESLAARSPASERRDYEGERGYGQQPQRKKKKESFLSELFEF
jgi:uncharacterized protein